MAAETRIAASDETITYLSRERLIKLLGTEAAQLLVRAFGGARFCVPVPESAGARMLAETLHDGRAAEKLCVEFGGLRIVMPVRIVQVKARIRELARAGLGAPQIARELGTAERYVYEVLAKIIE